MKNVHLGKLLLGKYILGNPIKDEAIFARSLQKYLTFALYSKYEFIWLIGFNCHESLTSYIVALNCSNIQTCKKLLHR